MASKLAISRANQKADQLCALLAVIDKDGAKYEETILASLISLAFHLSGDVSQTLIDLDEKAGD
ncbi:hypothetical protein [Pantoea stewartii]|uniref:Prophage protein n=1 Tax=Pantoea stewartii subsp. stewartii DC283 TaxID=660596 RepID=A0ABM6K8L2_PANSE|nr:hypothetical protein [Pantoea stewartii]ARF51122.1 hypothetical protein DSJ_18575 [Pantoea stewartii subsp. stewartii DC283]KAB0555129.1 hypothetical protein F7Q90_09950 [Pantoea stewartii subsp. stewartii]